MTKVSELEASVLGQVWKHGPCTAYSVRKHFLESPTSRFSGSAGAIYPLVSRLEARGLLRSREVGRGRRPGKKLEVTPSGRAALRRWVEAPLGGEESGTYDPLRAKMVFLGSLSPAKRRRWLEEAERALAAHLKRLEAHREAYAGETDPYFEIASWNALDQARSRIRWIRRAKARLTAATR
jgi:DNA-binding PadR family transcriptional regulator